MGNNSDITAQERQGHTSGTGRNIKTQETKQKILFYGPLCTVRVCYSLAINNKLLARDRVKIPAQSRAILTPLPSTSRWRHSIPGQSQSTWGSTGNVPLSPCPAKIPSGLHRSALPSAGKSLRPHLPQAGTETQQTIPEQTPESPDFCPKTW